MKICNKCGAIYPDTDTICPSCNGDGSRELSDAEQYTIIEQNTNSNSAAKNICILWGILLILFGILFSSARLFLIIFGCVLFVCGIVITSTSDNSNKIVMKNEGYREFNLNNSKPEFSYEQRTDDFYKLRDSDVVRLHYQYCIKYQELYALVTKSKDYFGQAAQEVIFYTLKDISIFKDFEQIHKECHEILPSYPAFKILALLYEHQKEYRQAIDICQMAINYGLNDDGTKGGMIARISRLQKQLYNIK